MRSLKPLVEPMDTFSSRHPGDPTRRVSEFTDVRDVVTLVCMSPFRKLYVVFAAVELREQLEQLQ
jgi:hypothetical protein